MPAYNSSKYIARSINSVLRQTYSSWELLIIDDCSTDNTCAIALKYADSDFRIRLLKNNINSEAAVSRNYGLLEAKGKWIAFLDSDDVWLDKKLELQLKFMLENNYSFTYTNYRLEIDNKLSDYIYTGPKIVTRKKLAQYCYFSTITVMYNREIIGTHQIRNVKKHNDYLLWLTIINKSNCYLFDYCLSYYVKHKDSISSGSKFIQIKYLYLMYRNGLNYGYIKSMHRTVVNIVFGIFKKLVYKKAIK